MLHELTITVDDAVYQTLKPMIEEHTISSFLKEFVQNRNKDKLAPAITSLRGTLHQVDTSDIRDEADRSL
jgi:predicted CopG family antitoxin